MIFCFVFLTFYYLITWGVGSTYSQQYFPVVSCRIAVSGACPHPVYVTLLYLPSSSSIASPWLNEFFLSKHFWWDHLGTLCPVHKLRAWWAGAYKTDRDLFALRWLIIWAQSPLSHGNEEAVKLSESCIIRYRVLFIKKSLIGLV